MKIAKLSDYFNLHPTRSPIWLAGAPPKEQTLLRLLSSFGDVGPYLGMPVVLAVIALVLIAVPSRAEEVRVPIPAACRELANRAGLPLTLSPSEAARAIAYIRVMISEDPAVARCRLALRAY